MQQEGAQSWGSTGLLGFLSRNREPLATKDDRVQLAGMNSLANALRELSSSQVCAGKPWTQLHLLSEQTLGSPPKLAALSVDLLYVSPCTRLDTGTTQGLL